MLCVKNQPGVEISGSGQKECSHHDQCLCHAPREERGALGCGFDWLSQKFKVKNQLHSVSMFPGIADEVVVPINPSHPLKDASLKHEGKLYLLEGFGGKTA